jgi:hypothetical protein
MQKIWKGLYWTPRILSIILLLFLFVASFDVFEEGNGFWEVIFAFLMHNIPVFVLLIFFILAWKREWIGAIIFILTGFAYIISLFAWRGGWKWYMLSWVLQISVPAFIIGILFWLNWKRRKK